MTAAGFRRTGVFAHSENWEGPGATPVQFTDDPELRSAIARAIKVQLEDVELRILSVEDLLHAKLRASADAARRRSKRLQDLADAHALLEKEPALARSLSPKEHEQLAGPFTP
jgi:hypothetical protein